jgi:hypothetical protein
VRILKKRESQNNRSTDPPRCRTPTLGTNGVRCAPRPARPVRLPSQPEQSYLALLPCRPPRDPTRGVPVLHDRVLPHLARTQPAARLPAEGSRGRRPPPPPPTLDAATSSAAAGSRGPPPGARSHADKRTGKRTRAGSKKKNWSGRDKSRNDQRTNAVLELDKQTQAFPSTTVGRGRYKKTTSSFLPERPTSASSAAAWHCCSRCTRRCTMRGTDRSIGLSCNHGTIIRSD